MNTVFGQQRIARKPTRVQAGAPDWIARRNARENVQPIKCKPHKPSQPCIPAED